MAFSAISYATHQYENFPTWWLKAFEQGTVTPKVMALDPAGAVTVAKLEISSAGFPKSSGNANVIPYIDGSYDLWMFPTAAEADANDTTNAIVMADDITAGVGSYTSGATVTNRLDNINTPNYAALRAIVTTQVEDNDAISVRNRVSDGDGGGGVFYWDSSDRSADVTADAQSGLFVAPNSDLTGANGAWVRENSERFSVRWFGIFPSETGANNSANIKLADAFAGTKGKLLYFPSGLYPVTLGTAWLTMTTSWVGDGAGSTIIQREDFGVDRDDGSVMLKCITVDDVLLEGIEFDGQLTTVAANTVPNQDLGVAGSYVDTADEQLWTGCFGVEFEDCNNLTVRKNIFKNFLRAGLRVVTAGVLASNRTSQNVMITENTFIRNRGFFGDSIFLRNVTAATILCNTVFDYQRIGIVLEQQEAIMGSKRDARDTTIHENYVDFGHDAFGTESNAGIWVESGDNVDIGGSNSVTNTAIGYVLSENDMPDQGDPRGFGVRMSLHDCTATQVRVGVYTIHNRRGGGASISNCYLQSDSTAAPFAFMAITDSADRQQGGIKVFSRQDLANVRSSLNISNVHIECVERSVDDATSSNDVFGAILISNGSFNNANEFQISIRDVSTTWVDSTGATDTAVEGVYQAGGVPTPANFFGAYGDIVLGGGDETPTDDRIDGWLTVDNFSNQSIGYCMFAASTNNENSEIRIQNTRVSIRTADINKAKYYINNCPLVDWRRNLNSTYVAISNSRIIDADTSAVDRTSIRVDYMKVTGCEVLRQMFIDNNGSVTSTIKHNRLDLIGNRFHIDTTSESMVKLGSGNVTFSRFYLTGNQFQHIRGSGAMAGNEKIIELDIPATTTLTLSGSGNMFDNAVSHVTQQDTVPTYNDAPETVAYPYDVAIGNVIQFEGV